MRTFEMTDDQLKDKILQGKKWLAENKSNLKYEKGVSYYYFLIDAYKKRGLNSLTFLNDNELTKEEEETRNTLLDKDCSNRSEVYDYWFKLRQEGVERKLFLFFIPSKADCRIS